MLRLHFTCQNVFYCFVRVINFSAVFKQYTPGHPGRATADTGCKSEKTRSDRRKAVLLSIYFQSTKSTIKRHIFYKGVLKTAARTVVLCFRLNH